MEKSRQLFHRHWGVSPNKGPVSATVFKPPTDHGLDNVSRETTENRTYGKHKRLHIYPFFWQYSVLFTIPPRNSFLTSHCDGLWGDLSGTD